MNRLPTSALPLVLLAFLAVPTASALHIREPERAGESRRVWQVHAEARVNPAFEPPPERFSGIGWPMPEEWHRQVTLISPRHVIGAAHYPLEEDWRVRFLSVDGELLDFGIETSEVVRNADGEAVDLFVATLDRAVDSENVTPFSVTALGPDASYVGRELLVFGKIGDAVRRKIDGLWMLEDAPGFDTTRMAYFDYEPDSGDPADIRYESGDSGSPAFVIEDDRPRLFGVASSLDTVDGVERSSMALVPAYLDGIDAIMERAGYHATRAETPEGVSLEASVARSGYADGEVTLRLQAGSAAAVHNVVVEIDGAEPPERVRGDGWITEAGTAGGWTCRRGGLEAGEAAELVLEQDAAQAASELELVMRADGVESRRIVL